MIQKIIISIFCALFAIAILLCQTLSAKITLRNLDKKNYLLIQAPKSKKELEEDKSVSPNFFRINTRLAPQYCLELDLKQIADLGLYVEIQSPGLASLLRHFNVQKQDFHDETTYEVSWRTEFKAIQGLTRQVAHLNFKANKPEHNINITQYLPPITLSQPPDDMVDDLVKGLEQSSIR